MSVLKRSVLVGLVLLALIHLNDGACWMKRMKKGEVRCQDSLDKTQHPIGSSWTNSKCHQCGCSADGMRCCHGLPTVLNFAEDCTVEYNYHTCTFKVVKKEDHSIPCSHSGVGK
ncbi:hypothetical protein SRHO_G00330640 [Serrasalmus rhombeus]